MAQWLQFRKRSLAFTLLEVIITLSYLGVIATYAIPKVLMARQEAQRKAVFLEAYQALSVAVNNGWQTGELNGSNLYTYLAANLNYTKTCDTNMQTQGCDATAVVEGTEPGFVLHNGATITGVNNCCDWGGGDWGNAVGIDWNGSAGPNILGNDAIHLLLCYGPGSGTCSALGTSAGGTLRRGTVGVYDGIGVTNLTAFKALFAR